MILRRKRSNIGCLAAGRVTAQLLLSFLAVSATAANAAGREEAEIPLPKGPILAPLVPEAPAPAEHIFVSAVPVLISPACFLGVPPRPPVSLRSGLSMHTGFEGKTEKFA